MRCVRCKKETVKVVFNEPNQKYHILCYNKDCNYSGPFWDNKEGAIRQNKSLYRDIHNHDLFLPDEFSYDC